MSNYGFSIPSGGYDDEDRLTSLNRTVGLTQSWNLSLVGDWNSVTTNGNAQALAMTWDFDNRMATAVIGSTTVSHKYDALGRRVARTEGATTTIYAQSGQQTLCDYVAGAAPSASTYRYLFASYIDEPVLRITTSGSVATYLHRNQQYSITALTNSTGCVVERYAYTAYGVPTITNASGTVLTSSAQNNRYLYTGREWDGAISLYHYRARMYDASLGRFCSRDPIGYEGDSNCLYEYCHSKPYGYVDPWGKQVYLPIPPGKPPTEPHQPTDPLKPGWPAPVNPFPGKPVPPIPPGGPGPITVCAGSICTVIITDISFPDPSDVCRPKWICYAVAGGVAGTITIMCSSDPSIEKTKELQAAIDRLREMLGSATTAPRRNEIAESIAKLEEQIRELFI